jgi:hypothetical protein
MGCSRLTVYWDGNSITETDAFDGVRGIVAPHVPLADLSFSQATAKRMAVRSFLCATDRYTDEGIRAEYVKYALTQRKKLLPEIFAEDLVPALAFYAGQKKITAANFDTEYLTPATAANAAECLAFLLEWSSKNISPDAADQQLEKELTKDPFNAADMKKLWSYKTRPDGTLMLTSYKGNERDIFVPERIGRKAVTALDNNLFSTLAANGWEKPTERKRVMQQIRTIAIPDSVTSISDELCYGCIGLTEITLPDSITSIGYSAFRDCCKLTKIRIPDRVTSIGGWAFCGCRKLTDISIPDGVTKLSDGTFSECSALTDITILPHVTFIGMWIFRGHGNLTVHADAGSPAEEYAKENGIAVVTE